MVGSSFPNSGPLLERGSKTYRACLPIGQIESVFLLLATELELLIAGKEFGIVLTGCVAFPTAVQDIANFIGIAASVHQR